jgi:hypothetical protein
MFPSASACRTASPADAAPDCSAADHPPPGTRSPIRGCALRLSTISSQVNPSNAAFTASCRAAGSRYGRPSAIIPANDPDAQHASTSRLAASGEVALKAASVAACGSVLTMRTSNQPVPRT